MDAPKAPVVMGIDPGSTNLGWAVLALQPLGSALLDCGVVRTNKLPRASHRLRAMLEHVHTLFLKYAPAVIVYESFVWFGNRAQGENDITAAFKCQQVIGGILMLAQLPPYPEIIELLPQSWGRVLTGSKAHTKATVAYAVNLRLGTTFTGTDGSHDGDAAGIGLVGLDQWQHNQRVRTAEQEQRAREDAARAKTHRR